MLFFKYNYGGNRPKAKCNKCRNASVIQNNVNPTVSDSLSDVIKQLIKSEGELKHSYCKFSYKFNCSNWLIIKAEVNPATTFLRSL